MICVVVEEASSSDSSSEPQVSKLSDSEANMSPAPFDSSLDRWEICDARESFRDFDDCGLRDPFAGRALRFFGVTTVFNEGFISAPLFGWAGVPPDSLERLASAACFALIGMSHSMPRQTTSNPPGHFVEETFKYGCWRAVRKS
jgi:hypothetical protein